METLMASKDLMWKDSYCIGVNHIDLQHKTVFQMVKDLLETVEDEVNWIRRRNELRTEILFLKSHVEMHFRDEEAYQQTIDYPGHEDHKKLHAQFLSDFSVLEQKMIFTGYDRKEVRQFAGILVSWLVYHIAEVDQGMAVKGQNKEITVIKAFVKSVRETLETMVGVQTNATTENDVEGAKVTGDAFVQINLIGDIQGTIVYAFSKEFALEVVKQMTCMELNELDEMVCSAMGEISNISSGNATIQLEEKGYHCDISTPTVTVGDFPPEIGDITAGICIDSSAGRLAFAAKFVE